MSGAKTQIYLRWGVALELRQCWFNEGQMKQSQNTVASEWMSKGLVTVNAGDSLRKCYQLMKDKQIRHLPVVDPQGRPLGILSDRDLQRAMVRTSNSPDWIQSEGSYEFEEGDCAQDHMSWPVQWVSEDSNLRDVAQAMLKSKFSAFLVRGSGGYAKGILTTDDLLRVLVSLLEKEGSGIGLKVGDFGPEFLNLT